LPANITLGLRGLPGTNTPTYFYTFVSYKDFL
jgi:hypothetical protein